MGGRYGVSRQARVGFCVLTFFVPQVQASLWDRGGGLIYDDVLNITWLQNANLAAGSVYDDGPSNTDGLMNWYNAVEWADQLVYHDAIRNVDYSDWRLPHTMPINGISYNTVYTFNGSTDVGYNISAPGTVFAGTTGSELAYMYYVNLGNPSRFTTTGQLSGCYGEYPFTPCLVDSGPFTNLDFPYGYWSGTPSGTLSIAAWRFMFDQGAQTTWFKEDPMYAWAVRDGDVAPVPEPGADILMLLGVGAVAWRVSWFAGRRSDGKRNPAFE